MDFWWKKNVFISMCEIGPKGCGPCLKFEFAYLESK